MLDLLFLFALAAGCIWIAVGSFARPKGVFAKSFVGVCLSLVIALALWFVATPFIANEAGLGAFFLFCLVAVVSIAIGAVACIAASARYLWDAAEARRS